MRTMTGGAELVAHLFERYADTLYQFLRGRMACRQDAEDVAQEAFVRVLGCERWEAIAHPRAFLFATAHNIAVDRYRREQLHIMDLHAEVREWEIHHPAPSVEDAVCARQELHELYEAIDRLPPRCRRVFVLRKFHDLSHKDIATELGISISTVEKHLAKALRLCEKHLQRNGHKQ